MLITHCRRRGDPSRTSFHPLSLLSHAVPSDPSSPSTTHPLLFLTLSSQCPLAIFKPRLTLCFPSSRHNLPHSHCHPPPTIPIPPFYPSPCHPSLPSLLLHGLIPQFTFHNTYPPTLSLPSQNSCFPPYYLILLPQSAMPCFNISSKPVYLPVAT